MLSGMGRNVGGPCSWGQRKVNECQVEMRCVVTRQLAGRGDMPDMAINAWLVGSDR